MAKIKVSQSTIDAIKKMGMTKALAGASKATPEMKEALTRMYGARRVSASTAKAPKSTPRGAMLDTGTAPKMPGKGPMAKVATASTRKPVFGGTAAQKAQAAARAGGNIDMNRTSSGVAPKSTPRKPYVAPKPTASQVAQAKARAGSSSIVPKAKAPETPAQKAAKAALAKKQRAASSAAVKRAGGRSQ